MRKYKRFLCGAEMVIRDDGHPSATPTHPVRLKDAETHALSVGILGGGRGGLQGKPHTAHESAEGAIHMNLHQFPWRQTGQRLAHADAPG